MSILKTTLKVESTTLFPTPTALTNVNNNAEIADSNFGKIAVNHLTPAYLVTGDLGAKGTFLYVKASVTNGPEIAVNIYGDDAETPVVTVFTGDTGFIPVTATQGKLYAKTTYGTANLEYFVGSRGEDLGQFTLVYHLDNTPGTTWKYFVVDANSGVASKLYDTGFAKADYNMDGYESGVQNAGIVFRLNGNGPADELFLTDKTGAPLFGHGLTVDYDNWWSLDGKGILWTYVTATGWRLSYYNGNEVYHHDFVGASGIDIETNWDNCSANGTVAAYIYNHNGISNQEAIYLIKDDQKSLITDINTDTYIYADAATYTFANYFIVTLYDDDNGYYTGLKIFDTSGSLLKSVNLTPNTYNSMSWDFYGTGHWQGYLYNYSDTAVDYLMFNYNQSTGVLIGEGLDWTHEKGSNFPDVNVEYNNYSPTGTEGAKAESIAILFYNEDDNDYDLITPVLIDYLDIHYVIGNSTTANKQVIHSDPGTDYWVNLNLEINDTSIQMLTQYDDYEGGPLYAVNFTTTGSTQYVLVQDMTTYTPGNSWDFYATGDYRLFQYSNQALDKTIYKVISGTTILDTLTIDNAYETNWRTQLNSIFIRTWNLIGTQKCWYFNTVTGKFVQLPKFYSQRGYANITATDGLKPNYMILISPSYWRDDNKWAARMLVNGVVSAEVIILDESVVNIGDWNWYLTPQGFWFLYQDSDNLDKWIIKGFDHSLTSTYTINTDCKYWSWDDDYNNINMFAFRPESGSLEWNIFNLGSLINYKKYIGIDDFDPTYVINDWNYIY